MSSKFIKTPTGVVAVEAPAQSMTQAQYDALPADKKNKGTYYIIDSPGKSVQEIVGTEDISSVAPTLTQAVKTLKTADASNVKESDALTTANVDSIAKQVFGTNTATSATQDSVLDNNQQFCIKDNAGRVIAIGKVGSDNTVHIASTTHLIKIGMGGSNTKMNLVAETIGLDCSSLVVGGKTLEQYIDNRVVEIINAAMGN